MEILVKILVTGAQGFIGRHVCAKLQEQGHDVYAPGREELGDLEVTRDFFSILAGIEVVVHLAARVHLRGDAEKFHQVNVEASKALAEQAALSGVKRFIFMSSVGVYGELTTPKIISEADKPSPKTDYEISKWQAEQELRAVAQRSTMELVILRPCLVYGAGVRANFASLLKMVAKGIPLPFGSVHNMRSMLYVGNLAQVVSLCISSPAAADEVFLVADEQAISTADLVRKMAKLLDKNPNWAAIKFPLFALRCLGKLTGRELMVQRIIGSLEVDISKVKQKLNWSPAYTMEEGLVETVKWWR